MKVKLIQATILALLCFCQPVISQEQRLLWTMKDSLNSQIVPFSFNFYDSASRAHKEADQLEIINAATGIPIQILSGLKITDPNLQFSLIDVNFDGIKDIRIARDPKGFHYYWVFNKEAGKFQRYEALERIANAEFDLSRKQIVSVQLNQNETRKTFYEIHQQKPVVARREIKTCDPYGQCETSVFVRESTENKAANAPSHPTQLNPQVAIQYLNSLSNRKAACLVAVSEARALEKHPETLKAQLQLTECYKEVIIDLAQKFYPGTHFGNDLEGEINAVIERHHRLLYKMANCPVSKKGECRSYEEFDVLAGTVDYLNELIEFMVLNIGEGYAEFNPEQWLKRWDAVLANA